MVSRLLHRRAAHVGRNARDHIDVVPHRQWLGLHIYPVKIALPHHCPTRNISLYRIPGGETSTVRNAINSHCSHPLMLGMNWPGKLITTQESIQDTEGAVMLLCIAHQRVSAESLGICLRTKDERRGHGRAAKSPRWEFPSKLLHIDTLNCGRRQPELTASTPRSARMSQAPV